MPGVISALPLIVLAALFGVDLWVYADATAHAQGGTPVVISFGSFTVETPGAWFVACLVLSLLFIPLYIANRDQ
jgi:hypothetical protein